MHNADKLSAAETALLLKEGNAQLIDVRSKADYTSQHIANAQHIDLNAGELAQKAASLPKDQQYIVHCGGGTKCSRAASALKEMGFTKVYITEGFRALVESGLPTDKT